MNVFLTGAVQTGKSTAIARYLAAHPPRRLGGFRTVSLPGATPGEFSVYIIPAAGDAAPDAAQRVGLRRGRGRFEAYPAVFETAGLALLAPPEGCDLLLMDEIGRMENDAGAYCAALLALLDGDVPILGVAKTLDEHTPLLDAVRGHPRSAVLDVTRENRDAIPDQIAALLG